MIDYRWLAGNTAGLIALSGGREGELGQALLLNDRAQAETGWPVAATSPNAFI